MIKVAIRTVASSGIGIGHLMRCRHLALEIMSQGGECQLFLDHVPSELETFVDRIACIGLYDNNLTKIDGGADALVFLKAADNPDVVILDDYRIHQDWETTVKGALPDTKICVIDDIERPHIADVLVDAGSRGAESIKGWDSRVPAACKKLLGPEFAMLSAMYRGVAQKAGKSGEAFNVLISLGGGGDLSICRSIADALLSVFDVPLHVNILVGPLAKGEKVLRDHFAAESRVSCLTGVSEVFPLLQETDFYIGAAGTMLLQLRSLNIPALTFSLAPNQCNSICNLENMGHYFHLNTWSSSDYPKMAYFARMVNEQYARVSKLGKGAKIAVDGKGCERIVTVLMGRDISPKTVVQEPNLTVGEEVAAGYSLRKIQDTDINMYRDSRNLEQNNQFMTLTKSIPALDHYCWWFGNSRESFVLEKENEPRLIIWHERVGMDNEYYMTAGWFVCQEKTDFRDVLVAMRWQVNYCDQYHHGIPWLSVVHKDNLFARRVNDYFGFEEMEEGHPCFEACRNMFSLVSGDDFLYIVYDPVAATNLNGVRV